MSLVKKNKQSKIFMNKQDVAKAMEEQVEAVDIMDKTEVTKQLLKHITVLLTDMGISRMEGRIKVSPMLKPMVMGITELILIDGVEVKESKRWMDSERKAKNKAPDTSKETSMKIETNMLRLTK